MPTRDQVFLRSFGSPPPTIAVSDKNRGLGRVGQPSPDGLASYTEKEEAFFTSFTPEMQKANLINPTNQGKRASQASRRSMFYDPRNSPSRSQKEQGYTEPIQVFASSNTWQTPSGRNSKGQRLRQPSTKAVSPFANLPIPTKMPWDL